jgi:hypothetical protein
LGIEFNQKCICYFWKAFLDTINLKYYYLIIIGDISQDPGNKMHPINRLEHIINIPHTHQQFDDLGGVFGHNRGTLPQRFQERLGNGGDGGDSES